MNSSEIERIMRQVVREELSELMGQLQFAGASPVPLLSGPSPGSLNARIADMLAERERKAQKRAARKSAEALAR